MFSFSLKAIHTCVCKDFHIVISHPEFKPTCPASLHDLSQNGNSPELCSSAVFLFMYKMFPNVTTTHINRELSDVLDKYNFDIENFVFKIAATFPLKQNADRN